MALPKKGSGFPLKSFLKKTKKDNAAILNAPTAKGQQPTANKK
ncbi:hypothetical protein ADIWIN_2306 [Winogradskyella psychrotolerans RS-3]|uniref:Uncharacterized protein n=1 Tax=Winogradskyella psychrotolerans RS-3 TaxID=641526 RepID=S7X9I8_9FLAO|nr:hypothetical protein ADIWIN_2306 [Winogradskyella psychrotolerans RS-3]